MDRKVKPDEARWAAGRKILELTDEFGFQAQAAGWTFLHEQQEWRYYLITQMVDELGPRWIYQRLLKVFSKCSLPEGITPLDIYVASPRDEMFRMTKKSAVAEKIKESGSGMFLEGDLEVVKVESGTGRDVVTTFFYRFIEKAAKPHAKLFDKKVQTLLAA